MPAKKIGLFTGSGDIRLATEPRRLSVNKYSHGAVLVVGGCSFYRGAPLLAAFAANAGLAALRTGAGYVTLAAPEEVLQIAAGRTYGFPVRPLTGGIGDLKLLKGVRHDVLVIGPGFALDSVANRKVLLGIIGYERKRGNIAIIDAGAIAFFRGNLKMLAGTIITPHEGEYGKLTGKDVRKFTTDQKIKSAVAFARKAGCVLVIKGNTTIITDGKRLKVNKAKTSALATMGTGDVLDGIIASYAAIHKDAFESAVAGVHVHSRIGDALYKRIGQHVIAQDIIDALPQFLKKFDVVP